MKNLAFIIIYAVLWMFQILYMVNDFYQIYSQGLTNELVIGAIFSACFFVVLVVTPFRYAHFQKIRNFGELNSEVFIVSDTSQENTPIEQLSGSDDYKTDLNSFFNISNQNGSIILDSIFHHKRLGVMILIYAIFFFDILFGLLTLFLTPIGSFVSIYIIVMACLLAVFAYRFYPQREINYQLMVTDEKLISSIKLKNGKSRKLKSINLSEIDYVTMEQFRSNYRLKFSNNRRKIIFPEQYNLEEVETLYPVMGLFITNMKEHTIMY